MANEPIASWGFENIDTQKVKSAVSGGLGMVESVIKEIRDQIMPTVSRMGSAIGSGMQSESEMQGYGYTEKAPGGLQDFKKKTQAEVDAGTYVPPTRETFGAGAANTAITLGSQILNKMIGTPTVNAAPLTRTTPPATSEPAVQPTKENPADVAARVNQQVADFGKGIIRKDTAPPEAAPTEKWGLGAGPNRELVLTDRAGNTAPVMENISTQSPYVIPGGSENDTFRSGSIGVGGGKSDKFATWKDADGNTQIVVRGWQPVTPEEKEVAAKEEKERGLQQAREKEAEVLRSQFKDAVDLIKSMTAPSSNAVETLTSAISEVKGNGGSYDKAGNLTPAAQALIVNLNNSIAHAQTTSQNVGANLNERKAAALSAIVSNFSNIMERQQAHTATQDANKARLEHDERRLKLDEEIKKLALDEKTQRDYQQAMSRWSNDRLKVAESFFKRLEITAPTVEGKLTEDGKPVKSRDVGILDIMDSGRKIPEEVNDVASALWDKREQVLRDSLVEAGKEYVQTDINKPGTETYKNREAAKARWRRMMLGISNKK